MERFTFTVDSALLGELGERLVSTVHVALTELVKNGYDADATVVEVKIIPEEGKASRVVVSDNGEGMTVEQVRSFWMKIGTSNKIASPVTEKFGRLKTGSKGIGRFACRRLGTHLKLTTTADISSKSKGKRYQTTTIEFDWLKFKPGTDVEGIECQGLTRISDTGKCGTELEIWGGENDEWRTSGIDYVMRQLVGLASNRGAERKGFSRDLGFNIKLEAPGFTGVDPFPWTVCRLGHKRLSTGPSAGA
jgi:DNA topoisomerase VI subunit B